MRYQVLVKDDMGEVLLKSQYRELKPMCLNEIRLLRRAALKDSLYERLEDENGCWYNVRAKDAHVLGTSPVYKSEEEREGGIGPLETGGFRSRTGGYDTADGARPPHSRCPANPGRRGSRLQGVRIGFRKTASRAPS